MWGSHTAPAHSSLIDDDTTGDFPSTPCFWNYFQYGLDFLIEDGVVTKVITHTNIVSSADVRQRNINLT